MHVEQKAVDTIQQRLTQYASGLTYDALSGEAIHAAKVRVIDTLGVLIGGFFGAPCRIARDVASRMLQSDGATIIGTRMKTTLDIAAFVNGSTARYPEFTDVYHWPGSRHGHPSDVIPPLLAVAEHAQLRGQDFITGVVLAYEIYERFCDLFQPKGFDNTNYCSLGTAVAAGKLLALTPDQLSHAISMTVVPNVVLNQVREADKSHYKVVAAGHAGRAGVFAALLARSGMEGPHLPFEGKAGWCDHVAGKRAALDTLGGNGIPFKILDTRTRHRPAMGETHASIFAAEKAAAALKNIDAVREVTVEVYERAQELVGSRELPWCWDPPTRECADQSIPYLVAAALMDGTVTLRSFDDAHFRNPALRALMQKIAVVENAEYTAAFDRKDLRKDDRLNAYERLPREHLSRITIVTGSGERVVAEAGGDADDLSVQKHDVQIEEKFRELTEDYLGAKRVSAILDRLWHLDDLRNVAEIPPAFVLV